MLVDGQFLFDNQLIAGLEKLIQESKEKLVLISPYICLDARIRTALQSKLDLKEFSLTVVFGKNDENYLKSIERESLEFLMQFPQVQIRYEERLHAKFYMNDFHYLVTSLNLYDYSLANNIEFGLMIKHASKGILGKMGDLSNQVVDAGVDKLKDSVLGSTKEIDPIEKFEEIIKNSKILYRTEPILVDAGGFKGAFGAKKLDGKRVFENEFQVLLEKKAKAEIRTQHTSTIHSPSLNIESSIKYISKSQLSKSLGIPIPKIQDHLEKLGLISGEEITPLGESRGIKKMKSQYGFYIAYPVNLEEIKSIAK